MKKLLFFIAILVAINYPSFAREEYEVQVSHNDEFFIINDEKFSARTYCFNIEEGDMVIFIEGQPNGICTSAAFYDLNTRSKCEVWCE